jgi:hypothetical protein
MNERSPLISAAHIPTRRSSPCCAMLLLLVLALGASIGTSAYATQGVTDWLNIKDYGNNVQTAIDSASSPTSTSCVVYVPTGTWSVSGQIKFPTNKAIKLVGAASGGSVLRWTSAPGGDYITMRFHGQFIENLAIDGAGSGSGSGLCLDPNFLTGSVHVLADCHARNCSFIDIPQWGVNSLGDANNISNACSLENCGFGNVGGGIKLGNGCTAWTLNEVNVNDTDGPMLQLDSASVIVVNRSLFGPQSAGTDPYIKLNRVAAVTFIGADIEGDATDEFFVDLVGPFNFNVSFIGCAFRRSEVYARLIRCASPSLVFGLNVSDVSVYLNVSNADLLRTDDIVLDSPSSANIIGGTLGDNAAFRRMKLGGSATSVFMTNFDGGRVRIPKLTAAERDSLSGTAVPGDVVYSVDRLNHWDGGRWREDVAFFPMTTATNASPAGINYPALTTTQRDNIPTAFKTAGTLLYNTSTGQFNYWDGSSWKVVRSQ